MIVYRDSRGRFTKPSRPGARPYTVEVSRDSRGRYVKRARAARSKTRLVEAPAGPEPSIETVAVTLLDVLDSPVWSRTSSYTWDTGDFDYEGIVYVGDGEYPADVMEGIGALLSLATIPSDIWMVGGVLFLMTDDDIDSEDYDEYLGSAMVVTNARRVQYAPSVIAALEDMTVNIQGDGKELSGVFLRFTRGPRPVR